MQQLVQKHCCMQCRRCVFVPAFLKHIHSFNRVLIQVVVDGPQATPVQTGAVRAGVSAFSYEAHAAGTYTVMATVHGVNVCNSPAVVVASIAKACPSQCEVKGCPMSLVTAPMRTVLAFQVLSHKLKGCLLALVHTQVPQELSP